jgi:hypothetical protein
MGPKFGQKFKRWQESDPVFISGFKVGAKIKNLPEPEIEIQVK